MKLGQQCTLEFLLYSESSLLIEMFHLILQLLIIRYP